MPGRPHHVIEQLGAYRNALLERMLWDQEFRCLCDDYDKAFEAVSYWEASSEAIGPTRADEFRHLLKELEAEILTELRCQQ